MKVLVAILLMLAVGGCLARSTRNQAFVKEAITVPVGTKTKALAFERIVVKVPRGTSVGIIQGGLACIKQADVRIKSGRYRVNDEIFTDIFREELVSNNYRVVGDPDALFEDRSRSEAVFLIAGLINEIELNVCYPNMGFGSLEKSSGAGYVAVDWQIYSTFDRKVVYRVTTEGSYATETNIIGEAIDVVLENAFAGAVANLLADRGFHSLVALDRDAGADPKFASLRVNYSISAAEGPKRDMSEILKSVVTVRSAQGHGSGFFISADGYLLTNEHVVQDAEEARIILENGIELEGKVLRTASRRDVALLKAPIANIEPLSLSFRELSIGDDVYALGSPLEEELHGTVSRGVVSALREMRGQNFIQSDVNVRRGSSGGPLVDDQGRVVGITDYGRLDNGGLAGLNFFIPIEEAVRVLSLD